MNDLHEPMDIWESFKQGRPAAFQYFFQLYGTRIYYYLLRLFRDQVQAEEVTKHAFIVLFHHTAQIQDADHLLRRLYLSAKIGYLLRLKGKRSFLDIEEELVHYAAKDASIMDDPDVAENETLTMLQTVVQQLPPAKREVAELYFFQRYSMAAIARKLGMEEAAVKAIISETLQRLGEELAGKNRPSIVRA